MASAVMIDDRLQIDGFDPRTWSGSYGLNTDGFPKNIYMDGSYTTQIDPTVMEFSTTPEYADDVNMDLAGNMYLKTASVDPAPDRMFPARKFEYPDGRVTWSRPGAPWDFDKEDLASSNQGVVAIIPTFVKGDNTAFYFVLIVLALFLASKIK
jgi:hypothetical protein